MNKNRTILKSFEQTWENGQILRNGQYNFDELSNLVLFCYELIQYKYNQNSHHYKS